MPGKINPSIPECVLMVCFDIIGKDEAVKQSAQYSILELNVMCPLIAYNILQSIKILENILKMFREFCIDDIKADEERCLELLHKSTAIATALNPYLGYQVVSKIVKESLEENSTIKDIVSKYSLIDGEDLNRILSPEQMTQPREADQELISKIKESESYKKRIAQLEEKATKLEKEIGEKEGATKHELSALPTDSDLSDGLFVRPVIFTDVDPNARIAREEIFGPVACVFKFKTFEEALELANDSDFGLAATVWTTDLKTALTATKRLEAGFVQVNQNLVVQPNLSYGGIKLSGLGKEASLESMLEHFTYKKTIIMNME